MNNASTLASSLGEVEQSRFNSEVMESLWSSSNPYDLMRLYVANPSIEDLAKFSRERPRADIKLVTSDGKIDSRIFAIIPTANAPEVMTSDLHSALSGISTILVESRGQFFNYASSMNAGIKEALNLGADWIMLLNDDMVPIYEPRFLVDQIHDNRDAQYLVASPGIGSERCLHSFEVEILLPIHTWNVLTGFVDSVRHHDGFDFIAAGLHERYVRNHIKFSSLLTNSSTDGNPSPFAYKRLLDYLSKLREGPYMQSKSVLPPFVNFGDFGIFKSELVRTQLFDETFINGGEDLDLSLRLALIGVRSRMLDYRIMSVGGRSLSSSRRLRRTRLLRDIFNLAYFSYKYRDALGREVASKARLQPR